MFDTIDSAIEELKEGKIIIVVDDESRENEGDFIMAAEFAIPEAINFMATHGRGLICTPLTNDYASKLDLPLMVDNNDAVHSTAFTVSIDHKDSGTGISATARSLTIKSLVDEKTKPSDLVRPGHIFPLISKEGGVLKRQGHTEASTDLMSLAGLKTVSVICEIMNEDGSMARRDDLKKIADKFRLKFITIADLIEHRLQNIDMDDPAFTAVEVDSSIIH